MESLYALSPKEDSAKLLQMSANYENIHSGDVLTTVANFYADKAGNDKFSFFHGLPYKLSTYYSSPVIGAYRKYLLRFDIERINAEMPFILGLEKRFGDGWSKISYKYLLEAISKHIENLHVDKTNPAQSLYMKFGYKIEGEEIDYYGPGKDAWYMVKHF